jgi:hypothetical protein
LESRQYLPLSHKDIDKNIEFDNIKHKEVLTEFISDIEEILKINFQLKDHKLFPNIIAIPWVFNKIYSYQVKNNYKWKPSAYKKFGVTCARLFEFCLNILKIDDKCLNDTYLKYNDEKYNDLIGYYLGEINSLESRGFNIIDIKPKNRVKFIDRDCQIEVHYFSWKKVQTFSNKNNLFIKYLRLDDESMTSSRIYHGDDSKGSGYRGGGGGKNERTPFDNEETDYSTALIKQNKDYVSTEERLEDVDKEKLISSPLLSNDAARLLGFRPASDNSIVKKIKISGAISANIAKINQKLYSDYQVPNKSLFSRFFKERILAEINDEQMERTLFTLSLLMGINHIKIVSSLMKIDTEIVFNLKKGTLTRELKSTSFAKSNKFTRKYTDAISGVPKIKTFLPSNISFLLNKLDFQLKGYIERSVDIQDALDCFLDKSLLIKKSEFVFKGVSSCHFRESVEKYITIQNTDKVSIKELNIDIFNTFFKNINQKLQKFINDEVKLFNKNIHILANALPKIHRVYQDISDTREKNTRTERSFFYHVSKADEVKMCYTSMPSIYIMQNTWYIRLQETLGIKKELDVYTGTEDNNVNETSKKNIGSPFTVSPGKVKDFFQKLSNEIRTQNDEIIQDNLRMVYIRFALSILLGTRDFSGSCDFGGYSSYFNVLHLQEKAKDAYSSKRIIPVCDMAREFIELFYTIKSKYSGMKGHSPCLIVSKESSIGFVDMSKKNLISWIRENIDDESSMFMKYIPLNFGRHIIKTSTLNYNIRDEFIDAFLGHFVSGTEDQGIYSTFDNQKYLEDMKSFLDYLGKKYLPFYSIKSIE